MQYLPTKHIWMTYVPHRNMKASLQFPSKSIHHPAHLLPFYPLSQEGQLCPISLGMFNATNQQNGEEEEVRTLIPRLTLLGSKSSGVWVRTHLFLHQVQLCVGSRTCASLGPWTPAAATPQGSPPPQSSSPSCPHS